MVLAKRLGSNSSVHEWLLLMRAAFALDKVMDGEYRPVNR